VAISPANRARTKIGVGEEVDLTVNPAPATWAITSGSGTLTPSTGSRTTVRFTANDNAGSVTITATGSGCSCSISLTVVTPTNWTMKRKSGTKVKHKKGRPACAWKGTFFYHPNDVNFYNMESREKDSKYVGTGSYSGYTGDYHGNYPPPDRAGPWVSLISHTDADGTQGGSTDTVDTGDPGAAVTGSAPPFVAGSGHFPIVRQWRVVGSANIHDFASQNQEDEIFTDGHCESRKGGNTERVMYTDDDSDFL
jgi:hypothetical protein